MSEPTTETSTSDARPARTTANLGIPIPGDNDPADMVAGWGRVADETDRLVTAALAAARAEFAGAIEDARTAGARPARTMSFLTMGV